MVLHKEGILEKDIVTFYGQGKNFMEHFDFTLSSFDYPLIYIKGLVGFVAAFLITYFTVPQIIKISVRKNLADIPSTRSSHTLTTPNLGGVSLFYAVALVAPVLSYQLFEQYKFLFPCLVLFLFVGVMDDIIIMRAYKKLGAQIIVAALIVIGSDVRLRSFFGIFGIYELPYWFSIIFSIFTFIIVINAINLIDGIDGLASGFTLLATFFYSVSYFRLGIYNFPLVVLGTIMMGSLAAYLLYNLSRNRNKKIFMGDTGSLLLGFLLCFISFCFIDIFIANPEKIRPYYYLETAPVIAMAIIILPLVDTLNVIITRILQRRPLFVADKYHIHHKVLSLGYSHRQATFIILFFYCIIVLIAYFLRHLNVNLLFFIIFAIGFLFAYLPNIIKLFRFKKNT